MSEWLLIENRLKALKLEGDLVSVSTALISQLELVGAPSGYITFVRRNGVGPIRNSENPFYWLELFDHLQSYDQIWGRPCDRLKDWKFFATSLEGECYAMRNGYPDKVWWIASSSEPLGCFEGGLIKFFDNLLSRISWAMSESEEPQPRLNRLAILDN